MTEELEKRVFGVWDRLQCLDWHDGASRAEFMINDARDLIRHGEPGVALENICQNLFEYAVVIGEQNYDELRTIGRAMNLPENTWSLIKEIPA